MCMNFSLSRWIKFILHVVVFSWLFSSSVFGCFHMAMFWFQRIHRNMSVLFVTFYLLFQFFVFCCACIRSSAWRGFDFIWQKKGKVVKVKFNVSVGYLEEVVSTKWPNSIAVMLCICIRKITSRALVFSHTSWLGTYYRIQIDLTLSI